MGVIRGVAVGQERVIAPVHPDISGAEDPAGMIERARHEAKAEGYAQGAAAARAEYVPALASALSALESAAAALADHEQALTERAAQEAADLAVLIAARIIGDEIAVNPDRVQQMIRAALVDAGDTPLRIIIHPDDRQAAVEATGSWLGAAPEVVTSPDVDPGGCIVETASGDLDARIPIRLESLRHALAAAAAER